jgi:branched-chain amino acid transport system substrate-binding protein
MTETMTEAGGTTAGGASGTVTIGALQPLSGSLKFYGNEAMFGFYSGLKLRGGDSTSVPAADAGSGDYEVEVGDVTYELLVRDTKADSAEAQSLATDLVQNDGVDALYGGTSSASALAVANNVAKRAQIPYMAGPAAAVNLTANSENCSEVVFRANETVEMDALSGGKYVANETDVETVYIYYADYSFGQSINQYYSKVLRANGVEVVGSTPLAPGYSEDWAGQFEKAVNAGADAVIGGFTVSTLPAMVAQFIAGQDTYDFRLVGGYTTQLGAQLLGGTVQEAVDELTEQTLRDLKFGPFTTRYHWNQYDNDINDQLIDFHVEKYGYVPDLFTAGSFTGASAIDQAVQSTGSTEGGDIVSGLRGMTVSMTPKGEDGYTFQEYNNQARSAMTVADPIPTEEENWNAPFQPGPVAERYSKDETTLKPDDESMTCSL